jgi:hypothetical protein
MGVGGYIFVAVIIGGLAWWRLSGQKNLKRKLEYQAEQRKAKQDEADAAWRAKQDAKNAR